MAIRPRVFSSESVTNLPVCTAGHVFRIFLSVNNCCYFWTKKKNHNILCIINEKPEIMSCLELVYRTLSKVCASWLNGYSPPLFFTTIFHSQTAFHCRTDSHHHLLLNTCPSMFSLYTSFSMLSNVRTELLSDCFFLSVGASAG